MIELQAERAATLVFISHDHSVARYLADHVAVMYLGKIVEFGSVEDVFRPPYHPYTETLLSAVPVPDPGLHQKRIILEGALPSATEIPPGCPFATRCPRKAGSICDTTPPPEQQTARGHCIACHIPMAEVSRVGPVISKAVEYAAPGTRSIRMARQRAGRSSWPRGRRQFERAWRRSS